MKGVTMVVWTGCGHKAVCATCKHSVIADMAIKKLVALLDSFFLSSTAEAQILRNTSHTGLGPLTWTVALLRRFPLRLGLLHRGHYDKAASRLNKA